MRSDWKSIGGLLEGIIDYRGRTPPKSDQGIPCISAANVKSGRIDLSSTSYVSQETYDEWATRGFSKSGDVIITTEAPVGEVAEMPGDQIYLLTRRVMALQPNPKLLHNRYLLFALQSPYVKRELNMISRGTTVPRVLKTDITDIEIRVPSLAEQKAIAHILGSLDDKIELNRQMNATLEAIAQALFKSWFVDFDPVIDNALAAGNPIPEPLQARAEARKALGDQRKPLPEEIQKQFCDRFVFNDDLGWVPERWNIAEVGDILDLAYGKSLPARKRVEGNIPVFGSGGVSGLHNEALISGPGVIVGRKGTVGSLYWVEEDFFPIDTVFYVVNKSEAPLYWLYQVLGLFDIKSMGADSAVPGVNRNAVYAKKLALATAPVFDDYESRIQTLLMRQEKLRNQNEVLKLLRDTLLPKLLSGQLRIPEAKKRVAEVI